MNKHVTIAPNGDRVVDVAAVFNEQLPMVRRIAGMEQKIYGACDKCGANIATGHYMHCPRYDRATQSLKEWHAAQQRIAELGAERDRLREALSAWEQNAEHLLAMTYKAVRIREGGGPESLMDSLIANYIALCETAGRKIARAALESGDE